MNPYRAYIKADPLENPEVIADLSRRLISQNITPIVTERNHKEILDPEPFLYFRNPYIRIHNEKQVLDFHHKNRNFPYVMARNGEILSVSILGTSDCGFFSLQTIDYYNPKIEALPILIGTHQRPIYFRLTLNSLLFNLKLPGQKIYIVLSNPDEETKNIALEAMKANDQIQVVLSEKNLKFAFANFGSKFFKLSKFIHFEDDGIFPENVRYHIPFWTKQINYRSQTTDLVTFRIFEGNWNSNFFNSTFHHTGEQIKVPETSLWHYTKTKPKTINPIGGMGMVIDSETMYKNFVPPNYNNTDHSIYYESKTICIVNVPIYHIGANTEMDYPLYMKNKTNYAVDRMQTGVDLRTKETQTIDLSISLKDHINGKSETK